MKWGLQHVKVTLEESETGEVFVIEQNSDGHVTCAPVQGKGRAANSASRSRVDVDVKARKRHAPPTKESEAAEDVEAAEEAEAEDDTPEPEVEAKAKPAARSKAKAHKKPRGGRKAAKSNRRDTALSWEAVQDHDYHGFAAGSAAGQFKALITKGSQWALFYELKGTWPKHIGCFRTESKAKERAQELHDAGWPESEFGPVTAGQVAQACPAPTTSRGTRKMRIEEKDMPKPEEKDVPKSEEKPAAAPAEPASKGDAAKDKGLMDSFRGELDKMLDEDEDD